MRGSLEEFALEFSKSSNEPLEKFLGEFLVDYFEKSLE